MKIDPAQHGWMPRHAERPIPAGRIDARWLWPFARDNKKEAADEN
ncbi:MAG TPA: hypothetical protein VJQ06_03415 [Rhizomicrobium sp.]|nr:hypothetical protein [Rhizomicrobium sp.]